MTTRIRITRIVDGGDLAAQLEPKMRNLGNAIGRRMQRIVPKRTWALHDTIAVDTERRGSRVVTTIGVGDAKVNYALYVERGTSKMAAQPFMRPALLQSKAGDLANESPLGPTKSARREAAKQRRADRAADRRTRAAEDRAES